MKKVFFIAAFMLCFTSLFAQDLIVTNAGTVIKAQVIERTTTEIKYKLFGYDKSPIFWILLTDVQSLTLENQYFEDYSKTMRRFRPLGFFISPGVSNQFENVTFAIGVSYFLHYKFEIETSLDLLQNEPIFHLGANYHFKKEKLSHVSPFIGLGMVGNIEELALEIPLGFKITARRGFDFSFRVVPTIQETFYIASDLRLGWRF